MKVEEPFLKIAEYQAVEAAGGLTKTKCQQEDLSTGTRYYFRIAALGSAGLGPWSDPANKIAA